MSSEKTQKAQNLGRVEGGEDTGARVFLRRWWAVVALFLVVVFGTEYLSDALKNTFHLSALVLAVLFGIVLGNSGVLPARFAKDVKTLGKKLLRVGVALLGFRLAIGDVRKLGLGTILCVVGVVLATFFGTQWLARAFGLRRGFGLLLATGYSICGASAIAAMEPNADAEPEEVAYALSLVTLCGTLSIGLLPAIGRAFSMKPETFGVFAGAAVHDVAQVIATSSAYKAASVSSAAIVKLSRVVMLAPMVTLTSLWRRRNANRVTNASATDPLLAPSSAKPPLVPLFVAAFLVAIAIRSSGVLPGSWPKFFKRADTLCLAAGMFALGTGTSLRELRRLGGKPLLLGLLAWLLVAGVSLVLVLLTQP